MENHSFWKEYRRTYNGTKRDRFKLLVKKLKFPFSQEAYLVKDYYPKINFAEKNYLGFFEETNFTTGEGNLYLVNEKIEKTLDETLKDKKKSSYITPFYDTVSKDELRPRYRIGIYFHELGHSGQYSKKYSWLKNGRGDTWLRRILYELDADFKKGNGKPISYIDYLVTSKDESKKTASIFLANDIKEFGFDRDNPVKDDDYIFMCILNNVTYNFLFHDIDLREQQEKVFNLINKIEIMEYDYNWAMRSLKELNKELINFR